MAKASARFHTVLDFGTDQQWLLDRTQFAARPGPLRCYCSDGSNGRSCCLPTTDDRRLSRFEDSGVSVSMMQAGTNVFAGALQEKKTPDMCKRLEE
jgi:hypothetical protein